MKSLASVTLAGLMSQPLAMTALGLLVIVAAVIVVAGFVALKHTRVVELLGKLAGGVLFLMLLTLLLTAIYEFGRWLDSIKL
ncbi:hypothetical protein LRS13_09480 [Svornostia abyssi]|uniref:Uncharacterized protein n=1 Tax=Svornostia abyssi TaxID=2898438 RepID=A0ABY5PME6_9ACTN|nr:hypothetical protein LRS13_09480 [Parviterribacteraceae bacterium J379]